MKKTQRRSDSREGIEFRAKLEEAILPASKLKLCADQLHNLNFIFQRKLDERKRLDDPNLLLAKSVSERLVQRLVCGAGTIDPRFSSKFLITLHDEEDMTSNNLKYLIRIDSLSLPILYEDDTKPKYNIIEEESDIPPGYAKIRLHCNTEKDWMEFRNTAGYLRRDKIQARFVELLAKAAGTDIPSSPLCIDESKLCGSPGKIMDAETLYYVLRLQADQQIFYGPGGNTPRFPDPRDLRLAIVDEPAGIRLRIEFLSPALANISINVRLLVGVGVDSWPASTDFPFRVSLGHSDCLLYYTAAQTGMYLVGFGVHSSAWQIRLLAAESSIINHYNPDSTIRVIIDVLELLLEEINQRNRKKPSFKILNKYILRTMLLHELESDDTNPTAVIANWSPLYMSTHVLKILDKLVSALRKEHISNYFFKKVNLLANPGHLSEEDYVLEARKVLQYLFRLFDESLMSFKGNAEYLKMISLVNIETTLLLKWKKIIDGLLPPSSTRGRRMCLAFSTNSSDTTSAQYTCRQLEYVGLLLKNMVNVKENIWQNTDVGWLVSLKEDTTNDHPTEDIIYILVTILEQAKEVYLEQCSNQKIVAKLKLYYNTSIIKLLELVRRDKDITYTNITDDIMLVKIILKWLYKAVDQNKKCLAVILKPFLNTIFVSSHGVSWHMDQIKKRIENDELQALGAFCKLINQGRVTPAQALMDACNKKWNWAKIMLELIGEGSLRLVFAPARDRVVRHVLTMPHCRKMKRGKNSDGHSVMRSFSFNDRNYFNSLLSKDKRNSVSNQPSHCQIKGMSPLTVTIQDCNKRGSHRCHGDIFQSLIKMHKANILQDIFSSLPEGERNQLQEMLHRLSSEKTKKTITTKWSNTLPKTKRISPHAKAEDTQRYTPTDEEADLRLDEDRDLGNANKFHELMRRLEKKDSLIGSCRAARLKEDNSAIYLHENFKAKSLTLNYRSSTK